MAPKISVIVPVYNTADYVLRTIDNLLTQTLKNIEIILINDGSTDSSADILEAVQKKDSRIKIITFDKNRGVSAARNAGLGVATGEYISFVDSDDTIDNNFLEVLYTASENGRYDLVKGNLIQITTAGETIKDHLFMHPKINKNKFNLISLFSSLIYKKKLLQDNNIKYIEGLAYSEDRIFLIQSVIAANAIKTVDTVNYYYLERCGSATFGEYSAKKIKHMIDGANQLILVLNASNIDFANYAIIIPGFIMEILWSLRDRPQDTVNLWNELEELFKNLKYKKELDFDFDEAFKTKNTELFLKMLAARWTKALLDEIRTKKKNTSPKV